MNSNPVTSDHPQWIFDMQSAPLGRKLLVLNHSGVAAFASLTQDNLKHFRAWCALPKIPKEMK